MSFSGRLALLNTKMHYKTVCTIYLLLCNKVPPDLALVGIACLKQQIFIVSHSFWGSGIQSGLAGSALFWSCSQDVGQHWSHQKGPENRFPSSHCWQEASVLCYSGLCTGLFIGHGIYFSQSKWWERGKSKMEVTYHHFCYMLLITQTNPGTTVGTIRDCEC